MTYPAAMFKGALGGHADPAAVDSPAMSPARPLKAIGPHALVTTRLPAQVQQAGDHMDPVRDYQLGFNKRLWYRLKAAGVPARHALTQPRLAHVQGKEMIAAFMQVRTQRVDVGGLAMARTMHLAAGSFAKVHAAMGADGVLRAMKRLKLAGSPMRPGSPARQATQLDDALKEATLLRHFFSPDVQVGVDKERGEVVITMPYAVANLAKPGGEHGAPWPPAFTRALTRSAARQLLGQLARMHEAGFAHQDIKPANVLMLADGTIRSGDMGLSCPLDQAGGGFGTARYNAPEALRAPVRAAAAERGRFDVWSLGLTLAESLAPHHGGLASWGEDTHGAMRLANHLEALHRQVVTGGRLDAVRLAELAGDGDMVADLFHSAHAVDPQLTAMVLEKMLAPIGQRADSGELAARAALLQPEGSPPEEQVRAHAAGLGRGAKLEGLRHTLSLRLEDEGLV